jgi:hypothetical protein
VTHTAAVRVFALVRYGLAGGAIRAITLSEDDAIGLNAQGGFRCTIESWPVTCPWVWA